MSAAPAPLRIALAQINTTVGDLAGNAALVAERIAARPRAGADSSCSRSSRSPATRPRTCCCKPALPARHAAPRSSELAAASEGIVASSASPSATSDVYNAAAVIADGAIARASTASVYLPNYGVFDEERYFQPGPAAR